MSEVIDNPRQRKELVEHPLERVLREADSLKSGEFYEIITPFPPMPMIEKLNVKAYKSFTEQDESGLFHSFFLRS